MTFTDDALNRLAPVLPWQADWADVLHRAGDKKAARSIRSRLPRDGRLVLALVALAGALIPLGAFAATNDWSFFHSNNAPRPAQAPAVVREGTWGRYSWQLVAYRSSTDGLCVALAPRGRAQASHFGAMGCAPFAGIPRTPDTKSSPDMTITYLTGTGPPGMLPTYIVGPVIDKAAKVEIRFANGDELHVPTFAAPSSLPHVRFYATQLPDKAPALKWLAGRDSKGNVVACLVPKTAQDGISPLSDCR